MRHRQYRAIKALSTDFSAEIYVLLKDHGGNPNNKGRVCTAIRYESITMNKQDISCNIICMTNAKLKYDTATCSKITF